MNDLLRHPVFLFSVIGYSINRFGLKWLHEEQLVIPYLNDVLCLPVVLTLALWLQHKLFYRNTRGRLSAVQVLFTTVYVTLLFEVILPSFSGRYTRDYWDIAAYSLGGILYYFTINRSAAVTC